MEEQNIFCKGAEESTSCQIFVHSQVLFQNDEGITSHSWIIHDTAVSLISFEVKKDMIPHTFENKKTLPALRDLKLSLQISMKRIQRII